MAKAARSRRASRGSTISPDARRLARLRWLPALLLACGAAAHAGQFRGIVSHVTDGDSLIQQCIDDCRRVGLFRDDDPVWAANQVDLPYAYVVYDHARADNVAVVREWLARNDVVLAGRYSEWAYYNSDHAFLAGRNAAEQVRDLQRRDRSAAAKPVRARRVTDGEQRV